MPGTKTARSAAIAALGLTPVMSAFGSVIIQPPLAGPTVTCADTPTDGGTLVWPNGVSVTAPTFGYLSSTGEPGDVNPFDCADGRFGEAVVGRKSGEGQKDFLKITMKEVFIPSVHPAGSPADPHIKFTVTGVMGTGVNGQPQFDTYWNIVGAYEMDGIILNALGDPSLNFLGFKFTTGSGFVDGANITYDYDLNALNLIVPTQDAPGFISVTTAPMPAPATAGLLGTGLLGALAFAARRRKRGW